MTTRRSGKNRAPRLGQVRAVLACGWLVAAAACSGVEADVLALRPVADLAVADAGAATRSDAAAGCTVQTLDTQSCIDLMSWIAKTQAICMSLGLVPGRVVLTSTCPMNAGQGVRFECCPAPTPTPTPVCTTHLQGDAMSCRDVKELLDSATLDCQSRGETASLMALVEPCAMRRYRMVKYMCCAGSPTPMTP